MEVLRGDITKLDVDAIVNAANSSLLGGGGVDGAIHKAGGPKILAECVAIRNRQGGCPTGEAVITTGGNLPARFVIHTVGPVWTGGDANEKQLLRNAYENSLKLARDNNLKSIAFPNISTGIYRFPKTDAATIAVNTVHNFIRENPAPGKIIFCCFDEENFELYKSLIS
jgi:O-acetyl-ADP-ribose deacetylase (regulator of RNase III)